jgi:hypothetical protein
MMVVREVHGSGWLKYAAPVGARGMFPLSMPFICMLEQPANEKDTRAIESFFIGESVIKNRGLDAPGHVSN